MKPLALILLILALLALRRFLRTFSAPEIVDDDWLSEDTYTVALAKRLAA